MNITTEAPVRTTTSITNAAARAVVAAGVADAEATGGYGPYGADQ